MGDFYAKSLKVGQELEDKLFQPLFLTPEITQYWYNSKRQQLKGKGDFTLEIAQKEYQLEVKSDQLAHKTGNAFWETAIQLPEGRVLSGFGTTYSRFKDYFLLYSTKRRQFILCSNQLKELGNWLENGKHGLKTVFTPARKGEIRAKGILLPLDTLEFRYPLSTFNGSFKANIADILTTIVNYVK